MIKMISLILSVCIITGCSCFATTKERVTVMTNVPEAEIFANGQRISGHGQVNFTTKRDENVQIMAKADGYYPAYYSVGTKLSTTGLLDALGIFVFILPFIGLLTPGAHSLDENNIALELVPTSVPREISTTASK